MSLGGGGRPIASCATTTDPEHRAICASTAAGVTYVVAAGNSGWDFDYARVPDTPAAYPEVLTVTSSSDSDGATGGTVFFHTCPDGSREAAQPHASLSNFAATAGRFAPHHPPPRCCLPPPRPARPHAHLP